jgi:hypothetical protein
MKLSQEARRKIDQWVRDNNRNEYGDPPGTSYAGGNPLFDERLPALKDRHEHIVSRNPEVRDLIEDSD